MSRPRVIEVGVLNLKIHPHSPEMYATLFREAYRLRLLGAIRGGEWGMVGWLHGADRNADEPLYGEIYKFLNIKPDDPWLNVETRQPLEDESGEPRPPVPPNLKPNLRKVPYAFYANAHRFIFQTDLLTPNSAKKLLDNLFDQEPIRARFGVVDVEIESTDEALEKILRIPTLTRLEIVISKPNPDDFGGDDEEVLRRFDDQGARRLEETWTSDRGQGMIPDEETKKHMRVARANGRVSAVGYAGETRVEESTTTHPLKKRGSYNPNQQTDLAAFLEIAGAFLHDIIGDRGGS